MWSEIATIYRDSKKSKDINWFTAKLCRPPAAFLVYFFHKTRITPNQVTFLSFFFGAIAAAIFALLPGHGWLIVGAGIYEFSFILDCADGQLARVRKTSSPLGHLLDFLMDEIKAMLILGCISVRLWEESGGDPLFLLVGVGGVFALAAGISMTSFMRRPEYGTPPITTDGQPANLQKPRGPIGLTIFLLEYCARTVVHYPAYIWILALVNRIDIYFWAYSGVAALYLARSFLQLLLRLGRFAPKDTESTP